MAIVDLSIVVAVFNEDPRNLLMLLERIWKALAPLGLTYEVIFVNDGSHATTSRALRQLASEVDNVKLIELSRNFGQQAAISAGFDHAEGNAVINLDSDCQDPPELIPQMVERWKEGYEVVYATRSTRRDRMSKRLGAFLFYRVLGSVSSVHIPWDTGDFRLVDRKVVEALKSMPERTRFLRGLIPWLGFKQIGIPVDREAREIGESTYTLRKLLTLAADGLISFSAAPLFFIPVLGALLLVIGLLVLIGSLLIAVFSGTPQVSISSVVPLMILLSGLQIIATGIIALYLAKIADEVRARPTYVVSERLGLSFARGTADTLHPEENDLIIESGSHTR